MGKKPPPDLDAIDAVMAKFAPKSPRFNPQPKQKWLTAKAPKPQRRPQGRG